MKRKRDLNEEIKDLYNYIDNRKQILDNIQDSLIELQNQYLTELIQRVEILPFYMICLFEWCIWYNEYHYSHYSLQL